MSRAAGSCGAAGTIAAPLELLDVQDEIARAIVSEGLRVRMTRADEQRLVRHPTTDGDAYDLYLQARHIQRSANEEDYLYSRELLQRAVMRDPNFALRVRGAQRQLRDDGGRWPRAADRCVAGRSAAT